MTRIFLTGATGNAGRPVLAELLRRNYEVTALVRRSTTFRGCRTVTGELADAALFADEVSRADSVVHLASPRDNSRQSVVMEDVLGTGALLDAWRRGNFVFTSSQTVYGIPRQTLTESSPLDAMCWYDLGKVCNEFQLRMAEPSGDRGAAVSLRMALLLSAGDRRADRQFLPMVYEQCRRRVTFVFDSEEGLETYGSSFIGEEDLGRAVGDALNVKVPGAYNLAGGFCTWRSLIETINQHAGTDARLAVRHGAEPDIGEFRLPQSRSCLDTSAFTAETGFVPRQELDELVRRYSTREGA